jgi:hypothetical protein
VGARGLQNTKFYAILIISTVLAGTLCLSPAISSLMNSVIIGSTGRITVKAPITYKSEIRGVFIHEQIFAYPHDWNIIAQTLKQYQIDSVYANFMSAGGTRPHEEWVAAINAFHSQGIEFHVVINVLGDEAYSAETRAVDGNGNFVDWNCPTNPTFRNMTKQTVETVVNTYDIDGLMLDYIRYVISDMCYCNYCKAAFEQWYGQTVTNWTDFREGGSHWYDYLEWRLIPVTELVRDIRNWALAIKPNLKISLAAWTYFSDCPIYWRKFIAQDTGNWIRNDYLDMVAPMIYTDNLAEIQDYLQTDFKYMVGGLEGKIPLVAFLSTGETEPVNPSIFKQEIDLVRSLGADGWIIWRYGGPGVESGGALFDITNYLSTIDLPYVFSLLNIQVSPTKTEATITWFTDKPATSKVEYSTFPLFNASWEIWRDFYYWKINHINGTVIEDVTLTTDHNVTITGLSLGTKYYFRVQSKDSSGVATSNVLAFTTQP